jgi:hypothetical protein
VRILLPVLGSNTHTATRSADRQWPTPQGTQLVDLSQVALYSAGEVSLPAEHGNVELVPSTSLNPGGATEQEAAQHNKQSRHGRHNKDRQQ